MTQRYCLLYTSGATFTADSRCIARFGPLAHILDGESEDDEMEHPILEGVYHVHRVRRTVYHGVQPTTEDGIFTVITVSNVDPVKVVENLERFLPAQSAGDPGTFDDRRWMELVGKTVLRSAVCEQIALVAYTSHLNGLTLVKRNCKYVMPREELTRSDINTAYVRLLTEPIPDQLRYTIHCSPDWSEFTATDKITDRPAFVGISHCASSSDMRGYVLYTATDLQGRPLLTGDRAFAVVFGPKHWSESTLNISDFLYTAERDAVAQRSGGGDVNHSNKMRDYSCSRSCRNTLFRRLPSSSQCNDGDKDITGAVFLPTDPMLAAGSWRNNVNTGITSRGGSYEGSTTGWDFAACGGDATKHHSTVSSTTMENDVTSPQNVTRLLSPVHDLLDYFTDTTIETPELDYIKRWMLSDT